MKRETKVGITVAGVFLTMAAGALGIRMWRGDQPSTESPSANEVAQQVNATPPPAPAPQNNSPPVFPPPDAVVNANPPAPVFQPVNNVPAPVLAPPPTTTPDPQPNFPAPVIPQTTPPVVAENKPPEPSFPQVVETPKPSDVQPPPPIVNDPPKPADNPPAPSFPPVAENKPDPTPPSPSPFTPAVENKPETPVVPPPVQTQEQPQPPPPQPPIQTPPAPTINNNPAPSANLDRPSRPEGGSPAPLPDAIKSIQPTGVAKPTRPTTDSYMEEEYKLKAGDNFGGVSKKFYYHEKYAQALQQYNRDYPLASSNLRADPPRMNPGLLVWIPPIRILEKRYPTLIADFKPVPGQTVSASPTAPAADAPNWTTANSNTPVQAQPTSANNSGLKTYQVRDGGETMQEIARRTMGNTLAWQDIYRLNPSLNPSATTPISAGTLLRLPASAKQ